jgi:diguanylate cyclase (GGDEF)-like protein
VAGGGKGREKADVTALEAEIARLRADLDAARAEITRLTSFADQDPLMPEILNRRAFLREMSRIMSFAARYEIEAALIYFDLSRFKAVNDTFGHATGDKVLRVVGRVLRENVRDSDLVGRLGGDEFAVVLAKASAEDARAKAEDLARLLAAEEVTAEGGERVEIGCAWGICPFVGEIDPEGAIARADKAMYAMRAGA